MRTLTGCACAHRPPPSGTGVPASVVSSLDTSTSLCSSAATAGVATTTAWRSLLASPPIACIPLIRSTRSVGSAGAPLISPTKSAISAAFALLTRSLMLSARCASPVPQGAPSMGCLSTANAMTHLGVTLLPPPDANAPTIPLWRPPTGPASPAMATTMRRQEPALTALQAQTCTRK